MAEWLVNHGCCLEIMRGFPDASVDSVVTDPPYGLSFMGKRWDYDVPSVEIWAEVLRVLKPGGHLLAFAGTRTQHRMCVRIEDAGFEIRDMIAWVYGSGFPKSLDVSKAIDKAAGAEREVIGAYHGGTNIGKKSDGKRGYGHDGHSTGGTDTTVYVTAPATDAARKWSGWGTALKPAMEPITVARKPLVGTVAANVQEWGTGALNVDRCRVPHAGDACTGGARDGSSAKHTHEGWNRPWKHDPAACKAMAERKSEYEARSATLGRWPANLIHDGSPEVLAGFPETKSGKDNTRRKKHETGSMSGTLGMLEREEVSYGDSGSAARFFYCAKASKAERDAGCDGLEEIHRVNGNKWTDQDYRVSRGERPPSAESGPRKNHHPTVKPTELMRYICRLVTPPGGTILDPFAGSGSTGIGAIREGFNFVGIEREAEYVEIARRRISHAQSNL